MSLTPRLRIVAFNDVYNLTNLPKVQTFLRKLYPQPNAVVLAGDFLSPSTLSALDGGKGMVATLRAIGITHACLGNHEADLRLSVLEKRLRRLSKSATILNSNVGPSERAPWLNTLLKPHAILETPCQEVRIGLMGLLSDEEGVFRDGTFRGAPISNVLDKFDQVHKELVVEGGLADFILPLTHQTMERDQELAKHMLQVQKGSSIILGGHEHLPCDVTIQNDNSNTFVRILKSGTEAEAISLIDLYFDTSNGRPTLAEMDYQLVEMSNYAPSVPVRKIVDSHMALVKSLENEAILHAESLLPPGVPLSSKRTRYQQTTVGGIFGLAIKEELEVDVAMINGATIKGDLEYEHGTMSYAQLKKELPFPTKIVVIPMKRWELHEAIHYSRTHPDPANPDIERKGYLQVDVEFDRIGFHTGQQDDVLRVALPRNLLKGFCQIQPLMDVGKQLDQEGIFPTDDEFIPAMNLVISHFCKERWYEIVHDSYSFEELDCDHKGFLSRNDVRRMLQRTTGNDPAEFLVDDMIAAIDADDNGVIDPGEFSHLLAVMEREHMIKFD